MPVLQRWRCIKTSSACCSCSTCLLRLPSSTWTRPCPSSSPSRVRGRGRGRAKGSRITTVRKPYRTFFCVIPDSTAHTHTHLMTSTNSAQGTISYLNQIKLNLIHESTTALTRSAVPQRSRWRWRWCSWAARATWLRRERSRSSRSGRGATGGGPSDRSRTLVRLGGLPSPSVSHVIALTLP